MDRLTKAARSANMAAIKSKNTKPEKLIFNLLKKSGYKFVKHKKNLTGKPDVVFVKQKLAVFIDGEFWHGRYFKSWKNELSDFWFKKINANIKRDKKNTLLLKHNGWKVIRIWDKNLKEKPEKELNKITKELNRS
ncbi:very short patch repair endonuclease [Candidatus Roizmanbacteria bacterium]|nr:very short patch repair endonuclease [Candidatus Roizmanbacteria bacterium]